MLKAIFKLSPALAAVHMLLTLGCTVLALDSLKGLDDPAYEPSALTTAADAAAKVLMQPAASLWPTGGILPDAAEWLLFLGNSLLWGFVAALLLKLLRSSPKQG